MPIMSQLESIFQPNSMEKKFSLDFKPHTVRDWEKVAQQELGDNPWNKLNKEIAGLYIKPYFDADDSTDIKIVSTGSNTWVNAPKVVVADEKKASAAALIHLNSGADGVFFELKSNNFEL